MPKNTLTAVTIKKAGDGKLYDGGGLMLDKRGEAGKWAYRYSFLGKRRDMGIGPWPAVSLADARRERDRWEAELLAGRDPISVREAQREAERTARDRDDPTLAEAVTMVFDARKATLRGAGDRGRWRSPLDRHVLPKIGKRRLSQIHQVDLRDALMPIWKTKHPTAIKAVERLRIVFRQCKLMGYACDPFTVDAAVHMLGAVAHVKQKIPATDWREVPALYAKLPDSPSGDCLRLLILTAVRMEAARGMRPEEVDGAIWTVPADRIKGREGKVADFRVPLSEEARRVIEHASEFGERFVFESHTKRPVSNRAVELVLDALKEAGRPHGFRSSFRSWCQDHGVSYEIAEAALGHVVGGTVERTYARSDLLDRRRPVMEAWAAHVTGKEAADVLPLRGPESNSM